MSEPLVRPSGDPRYRDPMFWARRTTRSGETIGTLSLDSRTALELGDQNAGLFVGGCNPLLVTEQIRRLRSTDSAAAWVVVAGSKEMALGLIHSCLDIPPRKNSAPPRKPVSADNLTVATPESLRWIDKPTDRPIAAILIHDMHCRVHLLRGTSPWQRDRGENDRPQHVATFRHRLVEGGSLAQPGWMPPLVLLTEKLVNAVETASAARAYGLDTWWFLAGKSFICGPSQHQSPAAELPPTPSHSE